jgi:phospholipid/cholesterol/gamma-HCH transport system ATP-binding protein
MSTLEQGTAVDVEQRVHAVLDRCLRQDVSVVARLRHAHVSVRFNIGSPDHAVVLLLDQRPPRLGEPNTDCDVEIDLTIEQAERFAVGALSIPAAVARGEIPTRGPIRGYLEADPIVRTLISAVTPDDPKPQSRVDARTSGRSLDASAFAIETRGLRKSFGAQEVLTGLDLQVPAGVISVVLGPSGTGKSVLLQHIIGLMTPDAGDVIVRGRSLGPMSRSEVRDLRHEVGVMFQDGALFSAMSIYDNCAFPLRHHTSLEEDVIRELVIERLASVGLAAAADRVPNEISGGMKKRAGLARAMMLEPRILLVDEPDSGLDPVRTSLLGELLKEQHAQYGGTILIVTHNVALAKSIGEHLSVLWRGKVLEAGTAEEIMASPTEFVRQFLAGATDGPLSMDA